MNEQPEAARTTSHVAMATVAALAVVTLATGVAIRLWGVGGAVLAGVTMSNRELQIHHARMALGGQVAAVGLASLMLCVVAWCLHRRFPIMAPITAIATGAACAWAISTLYSPPSVGLVLLAGLWAIGSTVACVWAGVERRR